MIFIGCGDGAAKWFGDGEFTIGKEYSFTEFYDYGGEENYPADALFIDDIGDNMYEEIRFFKPVD